MDPRRRDTPCRLSRLPRTRGDGPLTDSRSSRASRASPHTRGWTPLVHEDVGEGSGFPAHAGMDRGLHQRKRLIYGLPRTRGDGPSPAPIHAHRPEASPHTRGWTLISGLNGLICDGFPAHAGMDPRRTGSWPARPGLPRTRGDGPCVRVEGVRRAQASPHTRGWTPTAAAWRWHQTGFPAHAGMDPAAAHTGS